LAFAQSVRHAHLPWLIDLVQAYQTVAVFFDTDQADYFQVVAQLGRCDLEHAVALSTPRLRIIPCCYDLGPDLPRIAEATGRSVADVIALHSSTPYTVYAIGFCPGFPYLGYLPAELAGVPRLETPRLRVEAGSVGLTGRQTGIYTEVRPGGWNIVGRTPLCLVDVADGYFPLRVGDEVEFPPIDRGEFQRRQGERLPA
jgi:inhibitor of KinA